MTCNHLTRHFFWHKTEIYEFDVAKGKMFKMDKNENNKNIYYILLLKKKVSVCETELK